MNEVACERRVRHGRSRPARPGCCKRLYDAVRSPRSGRPGQGRRLVGGRIVAVLGTRYPDLSIEEHTLHPLGAVIRRGDGKDARAIVAVAGDADVILCGAAPRFDRSTLEGLRCSGIVRYGIGTDSIDLAAARELGVRVARVSDYG